MFKDIAFTAYPAKDVASLRCWYETTFDVPFERPVLDGDKEMYNEAKVGNAYFSLMSSDWMQAEPGSGGGVAFEIDDLDGHVARLRGLGIAVDDPYDFPGCRLLTIKDPEGNRVILHQTKVPQ